MAEILRIVMDANADARTAEQIQAVSDGLRALAFAWMASNIVFIVVLAYAIASILSTKKELHLLKNQL